MKAISPHSEPEWETAASLSFIPTLTGLNTAASCCKSHLQQRVSDGWLCFAEIEHSGHPESTKREEAQQEGGR